MSNVMSQSCKNYIKYIRKSCRMFNMKTADFKNNQQLYDIIGPPDSVSNLRPTVFARPMKETYLEKKYRELREDTQQWNQKFWFEHNTNFIEERKQFRELLKAQERIITADDMSIFYKQFLDKNWQSHFNYNIIWYKRNISILVLGVIVKIQKFIF